MALFYRKLELLYNDSKQTSISLRGVKAGVRLSWGVRDGGGPLGGSHTVCIVETLSQVSRPLKTRAFTVHQSHLQEAA